MFVIRHAKVDCKNIGSIKIVAFRLPDEVYQKKQINLLASHRLPWRDGAALHVTLDREKAIGVSSNKKPNLNQWTE